MLLESFTSDWLASDPVFYNEKSGAISKNINEVIEFDHMEFHPEGFNNYLDFGYSVFGQTPIRNVKVLEHSSTISKEGKGVKLVSHEDIVEKMIGKQSNPDECISKTKLLINQKLESNSKDIIIPVSGGLDSRLLCDMVEDKQRIKSYTYGISEEQNASFEVVHAKKLSEILNFDWEQILIGDFFSYFKNWDDLYGLSVHAHGMYQMEFYDKIFKKCDFSKAIIMSGIIGDAWAGSIKFPLISSMDDIGKLGLTHGMNASSSISLLQSSGELKELYFQSNKEKLKDENWKIVMSMRMKIMLLSYLVRVPNSMGAEVFSPFLDPEIAISMVNLDQSQRDGRIWQKNYFKEKGIDLENMNLKCEKSNNLDLQALRRNKLEPLQVNLFDHIINTQYIEKINNGIKRKVLRGVTTKGRFDLRVRNEIARRYNMQTAKYYHEYLVMKPIESAIKKSNLMR